MNAQARQQRSAQHRAWAMRTPSRAAFTLIEIVIVLTILAVLAAATVPSFRGLQKERQAREPVAELLRLAKEARLRAMKEKRPYQVALTSEGFTASRYFDPYIDLARLTEFVTQNDALQAEAEAAAESAPVTEDAAKPANMQDILKAQNTLAATNEPIKTGPQAEWTEHYKLPQGTHLSLQYWHEMVPTPIEGEVVKLWVFQPSGICEPIKLHLENEAAMFNVEFSALTVDIVKEASEIK